MIAWKNIGDNLVGETEVPVRSVRLRDETGRTRRMRVCTVWRPGCPEFTKTPCACRLAKIADGRICALITGKNTGYVKIGIRLAVQQSLFAPLNAISKVAFARLLKGMPVALEEIDGAIVGFER